MTTDISTVLRVNGPTYEKKNPAAADIGCSPQNSMLYVANEFL